MSLTITREIPLDYTQPSFPSLYWPINPSPGEPRYLYYQSDIWRFTLYWTLITYGAVHLAASIWAVLMQLRSVMAMKTKALGGLNKMRKTLIWVWAIPLVYLIVAGIEAVIAGSVVGSIVGAVYNAGYFKMSTWMPFLWGLLNVSVLILSSFNIQGGL